MTPIDKAKRLLDLRSKATGGEWFANHLKYGGAEIDSKDVPYCLIEDDVLIRAEDADFIATAANDITEILNDYLKVKRQLEKCKEQRNAALCVLSPQDQIDGRRQWDAELEQVGTEDK